MLHRSDLTPVANNLWDGPGAAARALSDVQHRSSSEIVVLAAGPAAPGNIPGDWSKVFNALGAPAVGDLSHGNWSAIGLPGRSSGGWSNSRGSIRGYFQHDRVGPYSFVPGRGSGWTSTLRGHPRARTSSGSARRRTLPGRSSARGMAVSARAAFKCCRCLRGRSRRRRWAPRRLPPTGVAWRSTLQARRRWSATCSRWRAPASTLWYDSVDRSDTPFALHRCRAVAAARRRGRRVGGTPTVLDTDTGELLADRQRRDPVVSAGGVQPDRARADERHVQPAPPRDRRAEAHHLGCV